MTAHKATLIWLAVIDLAEAITAYELAAVQHLFGWHTISYLAGNHPWLGIAIALAMLGILGWWLRHFPRAKRGW